MSLPTIAAASEYFGVLVDEILSRSRERQAVNARCAVSYVMRQRDGISFPLIGRRIGGRDHTTIMYQVARARKLLIDDDHFAAFVQAQMVLPRYSPEAARLVVPPEVQRKFRRLKPRPERSAPMMQKVRVGGLTMLIDDDGYGIDDHLWRKGMTRGTSRLEAALRREHPERCPA